MDGGVKSYLVDLLIFSMVVYCIYFLVRRLRINISIGNTITDSVVVQGEESLEWEAKRD